ncbi:MAG: ATP-grasp fold amidoligase family protein [Alloprevotella sp.]
MILVKDKAKLNLDATRRKLDQWMKLKYGFTDAQIHYSRIRPCIIAEEMLEMVENEVSQTMIDYKVWCFHGQPEYILVVYDRKISETESGYHLSAYDLEWNDISQRMLRTDNVHYSGRPVPRPRHLQEMIEYATRLSADFVEVRVDFYETTKGLKLGELTFTTGYGYQTLEAYEYLGGKIDLNRVKRIKGCNKPSIIKLLT